MMKSRINSIHIHAPLDTAFDCVKNPGSFNELMPEVTFTDIAMTPDGVGTRYRFEMKVAGIPIRGSRCRAAFAGQECLEIFCCLVSEPAEDP